MNKREGYITLDEAALALGVGRTSLYYYVRILAIETEKFPLDRRAYIREENFKRIQEARKAATEGGNVNQLQEGQKVVKEGHGDFVRLHIWLPGTLPERDPASLIVNTPLALEWLLQSLYKDRDEGTDFYVVAKQHESVIGSGKYTIGDRLAVWREENLKMAEWWNAANH